MISESSVWISWLIYLCPSGLFKWSRIFSSFAWKRTIGSMKLSSPFWPCNVISYLLIYLKPQITSSRYFLSFALSAPKSFSCQLGNIFALCNYIVVGSSKHFRDFFHDLNPFVMYVASLFPLAVKLPFLSFVEQLKQNTVWRGQIMHL